ncbi:MAG: 30S ribosomal protein S6 [Clostridiales bacterium]|nr:30S ribosomal protein S6 [Clostridiales bacterium]
MNKYELAVVVSAKLEDEARAEVIEKVKAMITRFGGNVTDVDEWGKRRFAYEIQKMKEGFYYFIHLFRVLYSDVPQSLLRSISIRECVSLFPDVSRQEATRTKMV